VEFCGKLDLYFITSFNFLFPRLCLAEKFKDSLACCALGFMVFRLKYKATFKLEIPILASNFSVSVYYLSVGIILGEVPKRHTLGLNLFNLGIICGGRSRSFSDICALAQ
jgi:hypothetical protein